MFKLINKLHKKPHHVRNRIALMTSGGATLLLLVIWGATFDLSIQNQEIGVVQPSNETQAASPFASIKKNFSDLSEHFFDSKEEEEATLTPVSSEEREYQKSDVEKEEPTVEYSFE